MLWVILLVAGVAGVAGIGRRIVLPSVPRKAKFLARERFGP